MDDYRKLSINGYVTIKNGDRIIVQQGRNAIVRAGMRYLFNLMTYNYVHFRNTSDSVTRNRTWYFGSNEPNMYFGKDNSATTQLTDTLVSQIATKASSITNTSGTYTLPNGNVMTKYVGVWNTGVLNESLLESETLGEVGLWLNMENKWGLGDALFSNLYSGSDGNVAYTSPSQMFARFSLGDKNFVPNPTSPVIVEWEFRWEFI